MITPLNPAPKANPKHLWHDCFLILPRIFIDQGDGSRYRVWMQTVKRRLGPGQFKSEGPTWYYSVFHGTKQLTYQQPVSTTSPDGL